MVRYLLTLLVSLGLSAEWGTSFSVRTPNDNTKELDYELSVKLEDTDGKFQYLLKKDWERELGEKYEDDIIKFQHQVLDAAFDLLNAESGPVLVDYPEEISDDADAPLSCTIPPADHSDKHPAEAEALGLLPIWRRTYEKYGRTTVGNISNEYINIFFFVSSIPLVIGNIGIFAFL